MKTSGSPESRAVEVVVRSAKALAHPLRVRILQCLSVTPGSARTLAEQLGEETKIITYHLKKLDLYLEVVGSRRGRVKPESFFQLRTSLCADLVTHQELDPTSHTGVSVCPLILDQEGKQRFSQSLLMFQKQIADLRFGNPAATIEGPSNAESQAVAVLTFLWMPE